MDKSKSVISAFRVGWIRLHRILRAVLGQSIIWPPELRSARYKVICGHSGCHFSRLPMANIRWLIFILNLFVGKSIVGNRRCCEISPTRWMTWFRNCEHRSMSVRTSIVNHRPFLADWRRKVDLVPDRIKRSSMDLSFVKCPMFYPMMNGNCSEAWWRKLFPLELPQLDLPTQPSEKNYWTASPTPIRHVQNQRFSFPVQFSSSAFSLHFFSKFFIFWFWYFVRVAVNYWIEPWDNSEPKLVQSHSVMTRWASRLKFSDFPSFPSRRDHHLFSESKMNSISNHSNKIICNSRRTLLSARLSSWLIQIAYQSFQFVQHENEENRVMLPFSIRSTAEYSKMRWSTLLTWRSLTVFADWCSNCIALEVFLVNLSNPRSSPSVLISRWSLRRRVAEEIDTAHDRSRSDFVLSS